MWFDYWPDPGPAFFLFSVIWFWFCLYGIWVVAKGVGSAKGIFEVQLKYVLIATTIGWGGAFTNFPLWFNIQIPPVGNILVSAYLSLTAYAIIRYHLMDIRVAITRAGVFVFVYTLVLGIPFGLEIWGKEWLIGNLGKLGEWAPMLILLGFATAGPFIYLYIQKRAEDALLQEQRRYQRTLRQASLGMSRIKDMKKLLKLIVHIVTRTVHIEHSSIYLLNPVDRKFLLEASRSAVKLRSAGAVGQNSPLCDYLSEAKEPIVYDEIKQRMQDYGDVRLAEIEAQMRELDAAVIVPSFVEERMLALLVLGKKHSGKLYSQDDLAVFSILASQAALAIESIQFYRVAQQAQEKLSHVEKLAYLGKLASSVVHEIRNPLTTLKTFIEHCAAKYQDADFRAKFHTIVPAEISRMEGIVNQLLDLARPRRLILRAVNIVNTIDGSLALLENNFKLKSVAARAMHAQKNILLSADEEQLRQVFLNLFLNAVQAMEGGGRLGVETRMAASGAGAKKYFEIIVSDTGAGISPENLAKLFTPFHTTKKNGVGLGMPIVKDIVEAHHGTISVESREGEGTVFTICLPAG